MRPACSYRNSVLLEIPIVAAACEGGRYVCDGGLVGKGFGIVPDIFFNTHSSKKCVPLVSVVDAIFPCFIHRRSVLLEIVRIFAD